MAEIFGKSELASKTKGFLAQTIRPSPAERDTLKFTAIATKIAQKSARLLKIQYVMDPYTNVLAHLGLSVKRFFR